VGVANGAQWQFIVNNPAWVLNHDYTAKAVVTPTYFELYLDGQLLRHVAWGFAGLPNQDLLLDTVLPGGWLRQLSHFAKLHRCGVERRSRGSGHFRG